MMLLLHVSFNLEFTLYVYINILWAWDQILFLSVKMKRNVEENKTVLTDKEF